MEYNKYQNLSKKALGSEKAQLVFKNAEVINVFSEEIITADIAVEDGIIVGVGNYSGKIEIDLTNKFVAPGFIDAHLHLESTLVTPDYFVDTALKYGTTTYIVDPHEAVNVAGEDGLDYIIEATEQLHANIYIMLPSCVPVTPLEDNGALFNHENMAKYLKHPRILGLGEVMSYNDLINADKELYKKIELFDNHIKDGHAPGLDDKSLAAYALAGIATDHECIDFEYAMKEIRNGMQVLIREGSGAHNLEAIVKGIVENNIDTTFFSFCTDDKHIDDIEQDGHISYNIKRAIQLGINPIKAIKMATINTARCYNMNHLGAIAPGYQADLVVLDNLDDVKVNSVFYKGTNIKELDNFKKVNINQSLLNSIRIKPVNLTDLELIVKNPMDVIEVIEKQIATKHLIEEIPVVNNLFKPNNIYKKLVVVERHKKTGKLATAPIKGFNINNGAIASSVAHDSHNIVIIGDNDKDILLALNELERINGGYVLVKDNQVIAALPLPIMGLISNDNPNKIMTDTEKIIELTHEMGVSKDIDPFLTLSFLSLTVIPEIRLTTRGIHIT